MAPIRVSRAGLVQCPACRTHTYIKEDASVAKCDFCRSELRVAPTEGGLLATLRGRVGATGGALAAALTGVSMAACSDEPQPTPTPVYGMPADVSTDAGDNNDGSNAADAGATDAGSTTDAGPADAGPVDTTQAKDSEPVALYGGPPVEEDTTGADTGAAKDAGGTDDSSSADAGAPSKDIVIAPLYGMPMPVDAGGEDVQQ